MRVFGLSRAVAVACASAVCALALLAGTADATENVTLHTSFSPDVFGASTTIGFSFEVANSEGGVPAPLSSLELGLPRGMGYLNTTLGLAICQPSRLVAEGPSACPRNSALGSGSAYVEVPFGVTSARELPDIQAFMGPSNNGNLVVLFYANGESPVSTQLVFRGELISGSELLGGSLTAAVPLIPSVAGGPPVSIISAQAEIGPAHLVYKIRKHGKLVSFRPRGVSVPEKCPHGGFVFVGKFGFMNGTSSTATTTVPCPKRR